MTTNKHDFEELAAPKAAAQELGISVATLRKYSLIVEKVTGNADYFARTKQKARLYHQKDIDDLKAFHRLSKNSGLTLQEAARQIYAVSEKKVDNTETPNNSENIISQNTNPNVVKKQEIEGLLFDNIILKTNNNMSYFTANVTNTTDEKINVKYIKITVYDNENKELFSFNNYIGDYIESKSTLKLSSNIEGDLTTIYSVKYEVIK